MIRPPHIFIFSCDIVNWCKKYKTIQDYGNLHLTRSFARGLGLVEEVHDQQQSASADMLSHYKPIRCTSLQNSLLNG